MSASTAKRLGRRTVSEVSRILGRPSVQPAWEMIHRMSLSAMNIGAGHNINNSGERYVLSYLKKKFYSQQDQIIVFDVGANVGKYTRAVLDCFHDNDLYIYSFEPAKSTFETLKNRTGHVPNVRLFNFGMGEKNETVELFSPEGNPGNASIYNRRLDHYGFTMKNSEEIELKSLDDFCDEEKITHIHLLKLDVEGHELSVLKGAKVMIDSGFIDFIQFEFGGCNIDSRTYFQDFFYLLRNQYNIFRILRSGLAPITGYKETYEIFVTTNYLAKLKTLTN